MKIPQRQVDKWWKKTEEDYLAWEKSNAYYLDNYREFILDIIRLTPQIRGTNVLYRLKEAFPDFDTPVNTFYRYLKKLREESGLAQFEDRVFGISAREEIGVEAQVDFAQYKMKTVYGTTVKVYLFCMVLSFSGMKFVYFSPDPFTTKTAIQAHEYAFAFFGGRTKRIKYDLDRVFVQRENYGNVILTKDFEAFAKAADLTVTFCHPRQPNTKARVEGMVGFIKYNFLEGRTYAGIDALNVAALRWLDTYGNEIVSDQKKYSPREMFLEERKHLIPYQPAKPKRQLYSVNNRNAVNYEGNFYELPQGTFLLTKKIRVEENDGELHFYFLETNELICKHTLASGKNQVMQYERNRGESVKQYEMEQLFAGEELYEKYMNHIRTKLPKYFVRQSVALKKTSRFYTKAEILKAMRHCVFTNDCKYSELMAFLIYKYGRERAKEALGRVTLNSYAKKALEIAEVYDGE